MASDLVDGDYLGSYRRFIVDFLDKVNPDDQLPIKTSGHDVTEGELVGEIIQMTLQYLNQQLCPPSLQCYIVQLVIDEIKATCRKQPESCGFKQEEKTYAPLKLMQAVASKVNEICQRYLENSRLALLPPPPSTPMPLANAFAIRNNRRKMEDRHVILHDLNTIFNIKDDSIASYYAVFDGHAGYQAAAFCAAHLHQYLAENRHYPTNPERALREAFITTDMIFVQKSTRQTLSSGTTVVCALILNRKLYVAWVGDSQAALAKRGIVSQLVNPHKPDRNDERERVEQMGGTVLHIGIWRVNGSLAVSRAIGDAQYKPYVIGEPEIRCVTLDGDEDFLIIGCDGLWDYVTENEAAALVYRDLYRDPYNYETASQQLVEYAKSQGSIDNITVIVVFLAAPSKIASRSSHYGNPLLADVQLDNMEPDNRFLSNANGQFDMNSGFAKQTTTNNGSPELMDDDDRYDSYAKKSSNGKHRENGDSTVKSVDYDAEEDDDDLGPETDVDALDDVSENLPTLADVSRQLFPEKQDHREIYESEERMDDETPSSPKATKTNQQALIPESDNVGDSEDSEDEWNYYRIDPNKEKESAGAAGFNPELKADNETREDIEEAASSPIEHDQLLDEEKNESDSSSESDSEREIRSNALIDNEISADTKIESISPSTEEEKVEKEETEKFEPEKESEESNLKEQQDEKEDQEEDMDFQLNPNAAEFVPVSPTPIISTRMDLDAPIAGSPLKQTPVMDDIAIPSRREFENEVRNRPCEIEDKSSCTNGQLLAELDDCVVQKPSATSIFNPDESEVSSTKAEFGDESSFLTTSELQRTGVSNLDGSFTDSYSGFEDSAVDTMTKSFGPGDFMALGNPVDLNAVHDLSDADLMIEENSPPDNEEEEEKLNLDINPASEANTESVESQYREESNIDPFSTNQIANMSETSSPVLSPSLPIHEVHFGNEIAENSTETPVSTVSEADEVAKEKEKSSNEVDFASSISQPFYDETNITSKLLEMDLEDRGSQDCGFEKCNEKFATEDENSQKRDEVADFLSSPVPRDDSVASPVSESLPVESPQVEEVEKLEKPLCVLHVDNDKPAKSTVAPKVPVLLNPLDLNVEKTENPDDDITVDDEEDDQVQEAPDSPVVELTPLVPEEKQKKNPFESADFGSPLSFDNPHRDILNLQDLEIKDEPLEPKVVKTLLEIQKSREIPSETGDVSSDLKLSESLQEFTGLEEQLNPENSSKVTNGLPAENLLEIQSEESKIDHVLPATPCPSTELVVEPKAEEELTKKPLEDEKNIETPIAVEDPKKVEKEEVVATAIAAAATAVAAGTVAAVATKSSKAKLTTAKTAVKSATKVPANKSTPTSPTKPAVTARTSSLTAAKKTASTTSTARSTKLETGKVATAASKPSATATKSTTSPPKMSGRSSITSQRTKPTTSLTSKISLSSVDKKPTTNGDATKSSSATSKVSSTGARAPSKPLVKSSTTRATSATTTAATTAAKARATSAAATSTQTKVQNKTTTGIAGTTIQRPKTAPTSGATTLTGKPRNASTNKSPITEKQIKETANKQISSSRTSTTTTASKTSRTSVSSSTTTTTRRVAPSKTTSTTSNSATSAVPPPIRKPAPITRPGGKTIAAAAAAAAATTAATTTTTTTAATVNTNGKTHVTKITATNKTKVVFQNGVCMEAQETKIVTSTTNNEDEDMPKKDLSPVESLTDNQLIITAD